MASLPDLPAHLKNPAAAPAKPGATSALLATRIAPPRLRPNDIVSRTALLDRLDGALEVAVSVIAAPAGYGKSTALGEWYLRLRASGRNAAWLTLDGSDNDPFVFASHLVSTIDRNVPALRGGSLAMLDFRLDVDLGTTAAAIVNAVEALQQSVVLVLDDLHEISEPDVLGLIALLANSGSQYLNLVLCARTVPQLRLAKLRALGEVAEFSAADFRLDRDEARQLLAKGAPDLVTEEIADQ
ncbi:MAG: hypothetical protein ACRC1J_11035, partial [Sandaracinobacteroides sp.]